MAKTSAINLRILNLLEDVLMGLEDLEYREVILKNGKRYAFNPTALNAVEEKKNDESKIWVSGAGSQQLQTSYDDVFNAPTKVFDAVPIIP